MRLVTLMEACPEVSGPGEVPAGAAAAATVAVLRNLNKPARNPSLFAEFRWMSRHCQLQYRDNQPTKKPNIMKTCIHTLGALAIAASLCFGQDGQAPKGPGGSDGEGKKHPKPEAVFKKLDTNGDSSLSLDEFKAGPRGQKDPTKAEEVFKKIDSDSSGSVSLEELKAHRPPHPPGGPGKGKGKGKGGDSAPPQAPAN